MRAIAFAALLGIVTWLSVAAAEDPPAAAEAKPAAAERRANRLAKETSPYLLLHAHNPVEWYPWGEEAFAKAKAESKLIFLSIGYSSCYWCHVMERESFMDAEVAAYLNEHFVAIKVDREERPDIDEIYMTGLQLLGRQGGWPLTMFLTADAKPIVGGTYFPPRDKEIALPPGKDVPEGAKQRVTGLLTILKQVQAAWQDKPRDLAEHAEKVAAGLRLAMRAQAIPAKELPATSWLAEVQAALAEEFDPRHGGFGYSDANARRPKFPEPSNLLFLLERARTANDAKARDMVVRTLEQMSAGGIRDHLGGGFHRYSTDRHWRIPHFEKMLYDNAQLATVYAIAHELTGREDFRQVAIEACDFMLRELADPQGGLYSALDAETDGHEGLYYAWERTEVEGILGAKAFASFAQVYLGDAEPNFEGRYVLLYARPLDELAMAAGKSPVELLNSLSPQRDALLAARAKRKRPLVDTKILTAWNGLAIRGLADCGRILKTPRHVEAARRAADFALTKLRAQDGRLLRTFGQGQAKLNAYLDDYAFLVDGVIALHQATGERRWLDEADALVQKQLELFWDAERGGCYFTTSDHEQLIARAKDPVDSVLPSGNAMTVANLLYLSRALDKPDYRERAAATVRSFGGFITETPGAVPRMAVAAAPILEK